MHQYLFNSWALLGDPLAAFTQDALPLTWSHATSDFVITGGVFFQKYSVHFYKPEPYSITTPDMYVNGIINTGNVGQFGCF